MQSLRIILTCIVAAIGYGILHDLITAHVCVEYFTIGHPRIVDTENPFLLALFWGIFATWWVGLFLGILLALAARAGSRHPTPTPSLIRPIGYLLAITATCALIAGVVGWTLARNRHLVLLGPLAEKVPADRHARFIADLWAHGTSYFIGGVGGFVLAVQTWWMRPESPKERDVFADQC